ncbi:MAG: FAD-binding protein [Methylococcales bacterium]|jgi:glycolate oxidase|nr:FAD-binding protein [Methylococcales bacterium]
MQSSPLNSISKEALVSKLKQFIAIESILYEAEDLHPYECDALSAYRILPLLVVLPDRIDQVQAIIKLCRQFNVPIVTRGAGTGLSGGALPHEQGVLLSLAKLNQVIEVNADQRIATVQAGVRNLAISQAVDHLGLYYAPDPSSQIACTIGGNVAENSGGVHCLKYGLTVHNVQSIKVVTIEGEILNIGSGGLDSSGYDLLALMVGSEGMLGVIVEVTVKLLAKPAIAKVILASFDDVVKAGAAVGNIIAAGIIPAGLEMMDKLAIKAAEDFVHAGYPCDVAAILLCELDGDTDEVNSHCQKTHELLQSSGAIEIRTAKTEQERQLFWKGRKSAFPAVGRISPDYYCMDGTIPRKSLPYVLQTIEDLSKQYNLPVANVFHAGDGNLHPLILYNANQEGELERTEEMGGKILELCVEVGGTITGEHGVGMEKINQMCVQFNSLELQQFHAVKVAFDPQKLLNPGKAVPELHRCAEFGAMHVHRGKEKFPELERF